MSVLSLILSAFGFVLLGLATDAHHRRRFGRPPSPPRGGRLRAGGWAALAAGFVPAVAAEGWIFGPISWAGAVMTGAGLAFLALNLLPQRRTPSR